MFLVCTKVNTDVLKCFIKYLEEALIEKEPVTVLHVSDDITCHDVMP